jgi:hypothetical protein
VIAFLQTQVILNTRRTRPGGRITDAADLPAERTAYAMRDIEHLKRLAAGHGDAVGAYATALLDSPLPWTKMRQVYALLGLVKRWGAEAVEAACRRALQAEAVNVGLIGRMLERVTAGDDATSPPVPAPTGPARFARDPAHFATEKSKRGNGYSSEAAAHGSAGGAA